ncbi:MAG TPA: flagella basal body P-ring formation protein FlgA [Polyangiaceae bacterium]|jgi:hypothetical protein|nr:flagella basal body P-ring formation protein FlgA [Polyangiaceae bacterium]
MRRAWLVAVFSLALPLSAAAEPTQSVDHARLLAGDLIPSAPQGVAEIDLGPAPPPGGSRLLTKNEIEQMLRKRGVDTSKLVIPAALRIVGASKRISPADLATLITPVVLKTLPPGVALVKLQPTYDVVVPPTATVGTIDIPRHPRQKGPFRTTANVEMVSGGEVVARIPVPIVLEVSDEAARPDVARGARIGLVIDRRSLRIMTQGSCLLDANIGDVVSVLVVSTNRVIKAKITSRDEAQVIEGM